ncbi:hypothetical protein NQ318_007802 [Aromia moschata]|uniref:DUF5641 domain-containing protein n=1 Tax=Aromia moschata TaxID=1265417 RepID=A0AAV8YYW9_9CUCU|nr:hypothetical protein NQ318_007802 [Aromia moschata]
MENEQLRSLTAQRGQVKAQITRFTHFLDEFDKDNVLELELRLEKIDQLWKDFNSIQSKIECLDDSQTQRDYREHFENSYFTEVSRARKIINENMVSQNHAASSGSKSSNADVKLPIISIPHFYGDYREWPSFFDTFSALVDNNTNLSSVQKFHYLKNALKDNAKQVIESLEVSHENYKIAIDLLKTRFDNKKLIKKAHIASLFNISTLTKESYTELRKFLDEFNKHLRALKNMGELVDTWDCPLIHLITTKLDSTTKREWEEFSAKLDDPKIEDIKKFLADRCNVLETLEAANIKGIQKTYNKKASEQRTVAYTSNQVPQCPFCKGSHFIYACKAFLRLPVKSRYIEVRRMKLCTNCLRSGHFKADCKSSSCKRCQKRHSTFLHFDEENSAASAVAWTGDDNTHSGPVANNGEESSISTHSSNKEMQVLLSTALIYVRDKNNRRIRCFPLRKWLSNKREILDKSKIEHDISQYYFMDEPSVKTLGLLWNANSDSIQVITRNQPYERVTKRTILSNVSQIFDPLGLVGPTVIVAKIMLQRLWRLKLDWDEAVPEDLFTDWIRFRDQIKFNIDTVDIPESKSVVLTSITEFGNSIDDDIFTRFSSLTKTQRVIAYCLRFRHNLINKTDKLTGTLTNEELDRAMIVLIKMSQAVTFADELRKLGKGNSVPKGSKLSCLNPFLDSSGIIRVGGRLTQSNLSTDRKHPIVLSNKHPITKLIIIHEHLKNFHAGPQATLAAVRQKFWPLKARKDGVVRVVSVKTVSGVVKRPVTKICVLPVDSDKQMSKNFKLSRHCISVALPPPEGADLARERPAREALARNTSMCTHKPFEETDSMISETSSQFRRPRQNPEEITSSLNFTTAVKACLLQVLDVIRKNQAPTFEVETEIN